MSPLLKKDLDIVRRIFPLQSLNARTSSKIIVFRMKDPIRNIVAAS